MANKEKKEEELSKEELASIKADSELAEAKRLQKIEAEKAKKETKETYSKAEVQEMIDSALMKFKASQEGGPESLDEVDPFAQKTLTLARFPNKEGVWKFIVGFADTNTDEYSKEARYAFDIWNDLQKKNEAYVKCIFDDKSEMTLPLLTVIKKSRKVPVDILQTITEDKSYSSGRTEKIKVDGYTPKSEGTIQMKVTQFDYSYLVRLPDGREVNVSKHVVNWNPVNKQ